ncbi:hypothetical protein AB5I41_03395 [Sphingomonas sp. MMS24-JH45]
MGATTLGALIGGAIDAMSGDDDSSLDGAIYGAITADVKIALPVVATWAIGWACWKGLEKAGDVIDQRYSG